MCLKLQSVKLSEILHWNEAEDQWEPFHVAPKLSQRLFFPHHWVTQSITNYFLKRLSDLENARNVLDESVLLCLHHFVLIQHTYKNNICFFFSIFFFNPHSIDVRSKPHTLFHSLQFWIWNQGNFDKYNRNKLVVCGTLVVHYGVAHGPDFVVSMSNSPVEFLELAAEEVKCFISVRNDYADWQSTATST